ncbi:tRNA (adenosine(37)-N6)-threonylcarbamoyltransferase complex ATPase subunit type 1 TsaE [Nocardioides sp.]|uniref:tRNA (adenosine(37)-N6)-threonylcarbamoyltransferase complex ATPase subunit type 1 TsaE n=1 Tax=Nocardioides sp. TaxID=35761 RepID=UPI002725E6F0|nr:tRNA (adenosine(37)-N6)-threonylcarbamoyltransferase complex ATPase subunit type 1 TsaE [Nocardioides sp.]MDO9454659.1 tRNA (adenosine(37)-N6)-threonylcarbamoyltransferase complex ATPase subunit type 1 TsaE [Nocardioides sp.]
MTVRRVGPESAAIVLDIVREAFGSRPPLDPPADALRETESSIATRLALGGGLVARLDGEPVGALIMDAVGDSVYLRRFGVLTSAQGHGVAGAMIQAASEAAVGRAWLRVVAREELPRTVGFWAHRGFTQTDRNSPYVELVRPVPSFHHVPTAEDMRALGARVAQDLRPGDLVVLTGDLGAGKTTFTQGLGLGLGVQGPVTSPTFVIAREHATRGTGPQLVHVDAYRLGGAAELDDLDLDTAFDDAVTVVEWGEGIAEDLADSRLQVRISRDPAAGVDPDAEPDPRTVEILRLGPRWART